MSLKTVNLLLNNKLKADISKNLKILCDTGYLSIFLNITHTMNVYVLHLLLILKYHLKEGIPKSKLAKISKTGSEFT